jgi:hypothetical protein
MRTARRPHEELAETRVGAREPLPCPAHDSTGAFLPFLLNWARFGQVAKWVSRLPSGPGGSIGMRFPFGVRHHPTDRPQPRQVPDSRKW